MRLILNLQASSGLCPHPLRSYARNDPLAHQMRLLRNELPYDLSFWNQPFLPRQVYTQRRKLCHHKTLVKMRVALRDAPKPAFAADNSRQGQVTISVGAARALTKYSARFAQATNENPRLSLRNPRVFVRNLSVCQGTDGLVVILKSQVCN